MLLSDEWEFECAMLLEEAKEQERFDAFYSSIPKLIVRHKTLESHLPLIFITTAQKNKSEDLVRAQMKKDLP